MNKKAYTTPSIKAVKMESESILAATNGLNYNGTQGDLPDDDDDDNYAPPSSGRSFRRIFSSGSTDNDE